MRKHRKHNKVEPPRLDIRNYDKTKENGTCPLCGRVMPSQECSEHHLIPVVKGGRNGSTVTLHRVCHSKIHSMFTEKELRDSYDTIAKLKGNEKIRDFIKWINKKPPDYYDSSKFTNNISRRKN